MMSDSCGNSNKSLNFNEKLFIDYYFRILQYQRSDLKRKNLLDTIRDFIRQSNIHCSQQNMTVLGAQNFNAELYKEYFKLIDNKEQEGLLSVIYKADNKKSSRLDPEEKQHHQAATNNLKKFTNFLYSFKKSTTNECLAQTKNPITSVSVKKNVSLFKNNEQPKINLQYKRNGYSDLTHKRPLKINHSEGQSGNTFLSNKKVCKQPGVQVPLKLSGPPESGFVSAKSMYRNPLKQANNTPKQNDSVESNLKCENDEHSGLRNHDTLKHFDKKIVDIVLNEIMDFSPNIRWSDIAGLEFVKTTVQEIVIWPLLRPDIFTGLRAPPRGILLFGPPGTGKTLIGKCIATESNSTFFCISASSLASKWVGESEQMVRALFAAARLNQPAVIFIDEIDSLLSQRSDKDQDFTRKLKTEFLVQFDGAKTNTEERVLVVGATNRPHELDEAARRRFVKRLYVPLPDEAARRQIIKKLICAHQHNLPDGDFQVICNETDGYSGSDVAHLCKEAAMGPIRSIGPENIKTVSLDQVRPIALCDFTDALRQVRASVLADDLNYYKEWNKKFGSFGIQS